MARPSEYTPELGEAICEAIANTPRGLDFICQNTEGFPSAATVHRWLNAHSAFCESYLRARERQADLIFDECLEIADDDAVDGEPVEEGLEDQAHGGALKRSRKGDAGVQRAKLRIDTRMRMAGKLSPKKYGDAVQMKHSGAIGRFDASKYTDEQLEQLEGVLGDLAVSGGDAERGEGGEDQAGG